MKVQNPRLAELFKTPQRKTYTLGGITAITVGIFVLFAIRPTFIKIADLNKEIKDKEIFLEKVDNKLETVNYLISKRQEYLDEIEYLEEDLSSEASGGFTVANLSAIADSNDIDLLSIEFEEEEEEIEDVLEIENYDKVRSLKVNIRARGGKSDLENYIEHLELFPHIFDLRGLSYSQVGLSDFKGDIENYKPLEFSVAFYIFYWSEGAQED